MILIQQVGMLVNHIKDDMTHGQGGTDTTLFDKAQTGLITPVVATNLALSDKSNTNSTIFASHTIPTTVGSGSTLTEFEVNNGTASYNRVVKAAFDKTTKNEYVLFHTFDFEVVP